MARFLGRIVAGLVIGASLSNECCSGDNSDGSGDGDSDSHGDSDSEGDSDADSDSDTGGSDDIDTEDTENTESGDQLANCIAMCEAASDSAGCGWLDPPDDDFSDITLDCRWIDFRTKTILADAGCDDGDSVERCLCAFIGIGEGDPPDVLLGCGEYHGSMDYVMVGEVPYLHQSDIGVSPVGSELFSCAFDPEGQATPPECACFCDWTDDPTITCDYVEDYCVDSFSGLGWDLSTISFGSEEWFHLSEAEDYCAASTTAGHADWRLPTIEELRTLVRDCPQNEIAGECPVSDACAEISCAGAECTPSFEDLSESDDPCDFSAYFDTGPCAACPYVGPEWMPSCYLPVDLLVTWTCGSYWSSTAPVTIPDSASNYRWVLSTERGAPMLLGDYSNSYMTQLASAMLMCVRAAD